MLRDSFKLSFKVILLVMSYYVLDYFFPGDIIIWIIVGVIVVVMAFNILFGGNPDAQLEILCDTEKYLDKVQRKYSKKDENVYNTRLAYAYVYNGEYDLASIHILKVERDSLIKKPKLMMIYYLVLLKLAFEESDLEKFNAIYEEYNNMENIEYKGFDTEVLEIPRYVMEGNYTELVEKLLVLIPSQTKRYLIIELEYFLALGYLKTNELENAKAVLEFVASKNYKFVYVEKCNELLKEL